MRPSDYFALAASALIYLSSSCTAAAVAPTALKATNINATFDGLHPPTPIGLLNNMPVPFRKINWKYLQFANLVPKIKGIPGASLSPNTDPIVISKSIVVENLSKNIPTMSIDYPGSKVKHFDLQSMYIACIVLGLDNSGEDCMMTFTGTKVDGSKVKQNCKYDGARENVMDLCEFKGFQNMTQVVMAPGGGLPGKGDTVFDTVSYTVYE